ncbi:MAG: tellurite resistance TerB family protein [Gammaproteobacteria bacterium]|nr:tellurite resistance TerB family protein [Gammaproteobacteria bacterium]
MDAVKILGSLLGGGSMSSGLGGQVIGDLLGSALGGGSGRARSASDVGLGGLLGGALGGSSRRSGRGGLGGGLGGVLGGIAMAALARYAAGRMSGSGRGSASAVDMGDLFGSMFGGEPQSAAAMAMQQPDLEARAEILVRAMIGAARSDGRLDASEEQRILDRLGELDDNERAFLHSALQAPVDARALAADVPADMAREVYAVSLLAIELDDQAEAEYLAELARALRLSGADCNQIHRELGAPEIFN